MTQTEDTASTQPHWLAPYQFKKGVSGNPNGRGKTTRNKLGEGYLADLQALREQQGMDILQRVAAKKPDVIVKVIAQIMSKELFVTDSNTGSNMMMSLLEGMTVDQLAGLIAGIRPAIDGSSSGSVDSAQDDGSKLTDIY